MKDSEMPERLRKIERIPGMSHALRMISEYSLFGSGWDAREYSGEKGKEIRRKGIRKIAEVWELSESAQRVLVREWVEAKAKPLIVEEDEDGKYIFFKEEAEQLGVIESSGREARGDEDYGGGDEKDGADDLNVEIVVVDEEGGKIEGRQQICQELRKEGAEIVPLSMVEEGHIYLDVTDIGYNKFCSGYKAIRLLRHRLGIDKRDMKRGALEAINDSRALVAADADRHGVRRKDIAEFLCFKTYCEDNPSGSYPLVHKYVKRGREIADKLDKLEKYLKEITGRKV